MKRLRISVLALGVTVLCIGAPAWADMSLAPSSGVSFQDEGTVQSGDHTPLFIDLDGLWAPSPGSSGHPLNYYATGTSGDFWDAVSLSFDLSPIGGDQVVSASLRFYTQQGAYGDTTWHHYEVLQGAFNPAHEDADPLGWPGLVDFGSHGSNGIVGWLEAPIPTSWITSDTFDVTLRLWNARIDEVQLDVLAAPVPGAVVLGLLGFGTAATGLLARLKRRTPSIDA